MERYSLPTFRSLDIRFLFETDKQHGDEQLTQKQLKRRQFNVRSIILQSIDNELAGNFTGITAIPSIISTLDSIFLRDETVTVTSLRSQLIRYRCKG